MNPRPKTALDACLARAKVIEGLPAARRLPVTGRMAERGYARGRTATNRGHWQSIGRRTTSQSLANTVS